MQAALLKPVYDRVVKGLPLFGTPVESARRFGGASGTSQEKADRIISVYASMGGATGFACGVPGILLSPITLPSNIAGVAFIQMHMAASIAALGDHNLEEEGIRDRCISCLLDKITESGVNTEGEEVATRTGIKLAERGVRVAFGLTLGGRATRGLLVRRTALRRVPLIGGVIGAGSDAYVTAHVGRCAKKAFLE